MNQKVNVRTEHVMFTMNHLLFVDNFQLLASSYEVLKQLMEETKEFFSVNGLEMNKENSATKTEACPQDATLLEGIKSYKYLGINETAYSGISEETFMKVRN